MLACFIQLFGASQFSTQWPGLGGMFQIQQMDTDKVMEFCKQGNFKSTLIYFINYINPLLTYVFWTSWAN